MFKTLRQLINWFKEYRLRYRVRLVIGYTTTEVECAFASSLVRIPRTNLEIGGLVVVLSEVYSSSLPKIK